MGSAAVYKSYLWSEGFGERREDQKEKWGLVKEVFEGSWCQVIKNSDVLQNQWQGDIYLTKPELDVKNHKGKVWCQH